MSLEELLFLPTFSNNKHKENFHLKQIGHERVIPRRKRVHENFSTIFFYIWTGLLPLKFQGSLCLQPRWRHRIWISFSIDSVGSMCIVHGALCWPLFIQRLHSKMSGNCLKWISSVPGKTDSVRRSFQHWAECVSRLSHILSSERAPARNVRKIEFWNSKPSAITVQEMMAVRMTSYKDYIWLTTCKWNVFKLVFSRSSNRVQLNFERTQHTQETRAASIPSLSFELRLFPRQQTVSEKDSIFGSPYDIWHGAPFK